MTALHVFDMDGTLLRGTSATLEIATALGRVAELVELEQAFAAGGITGYDFAVGAYELYRGVEPGAVAGIFAGSPWLAGIDEVTADIRARGEHSMVITMSPNFFADLLTGLGVDEVRASVFPPLPMRALPDVSEILVPGDKVRLVDEALARLGLPAERCVAYGDSASDVPLFRHLPLTVAVNATPHLRGLGAVSVEGEALPPIYRAGRELLKPA